MTNVNTALKTLVSELSIVFKAIKSNPQTRKDFEKSIGKIDTDKVFNHLSTAQGNIDKALKILTKDR